MRPRLVKEPVGMAYTGLGRTAFRAYAERIGAGVKIGKARRYDLNVIDSDIDRMREENAHENETDT